MPPSSEDAPTNVYITAVDMPEGQNDMQEKTEDEETPEEEGQEI
jgi:hypothetical protein